MNGPVFYVEKMVHGGWGLVHDRDRAILVRGVVPGEEVRIRIMPGSKKSLFAEPVEIVSASPERQEPPCPLFGDCGGCHLQHISYPFQAGLKKDTLSESISRIAGIEPFVSDILTSPVELNYRSRLRLQVKSGKAGFFRAQSRELIEVYSCLLVRETINERIAELGPLIKKEKPETIEIVQEDSGVVMAVARKGKRKRVFRFSESEGWVRDPAKKAAFQQVHPEQNQRLREIVSGIAEKAAPALTIELYAGDGNLTEMMAPFCGRVIAAESDSEAAELGRERLAAHKNIELQNRPAAELLNECLLQNERPGLVLLDPPRKGAQEVLPALFQLVPDYIVYVSCDPPALARDLKDLSAGGYRVDSIRPLDMFPQTYHLETVALFIKE
ncbi:MAG: hypothetical protein R6V10_08680 [bacterium]